MIRTTLQRVYAATGRRTFTQSSARAAESKRKYIYLAIQAIRRLHFMRNQLNHELRTETPELAKKQAEKIRNEEKSKEQRPSPISEEAKKKFDQINSKNAKK
ncbi:unnamed protein product [Umbelopsis sp. WA50703]